MKKLVSVMLLFIMVVSAVSPTYAENIKPEGLYYRSKNDYFINVRRSEGYLLFTPYSKKLGYDYPWKNAQLIKVSARKYRADGMKLQLNWINNNCFKATGKDCDDGFGTNFAGTYYRAPAAPKLKNLNSRFGPGDAYTVSMKWNKVSRASGYQLKIGEKDPAGWYSYYKTSKNNSKKIGVGTSVMQVRIKIRTYHTLKGGYKIYGPWSKTKYKTIYSD